MKIPIPSGYLRQLKNIPKWFHDDLFRDLFKNAGNLLSGYIVSWGLGLVTFSLTARILGPTDFGVLVLITTYVTFVDTILNFQSWQAVIKFGAEALEGNRPDDFKSVVKVGALLDVSTAILGTLLSILIVVGVGELLNWEPGTAELAAVYSLVILFNVAGTPVGILRLFKRFKTYASQRVIAAAIKVTAIGYLFITGGSLWTVLWAWKITTILGQLVLVGMGWHELRRQGYHRVFWAPVRGISGRFPGVWHFLISTNLISSIKLSFREADVLIIGGVLGPLSAGLYKVVKQLAAIPVLLTDPLGQTIYPDLSTLWVKNEYSKFKSLILRSGLLAGSGGLAIWVGFVALGPWIIQLFFGQEFIDAYPVLVPYMFGMIISIFSFPLSPALLAMGQAKLSLWIQTLSVLLYFPLLFVSLKAFGLIGTGVAIVGFYILWSALMLFYGNRILEKERYTLTLSKGMDVLMDWKR
ncbi:MAG TPA: oligosaccharide flippase family protein [Methanomicrobiales archaeon]|nr:oligosaccharide flippase family protein [Methanomicrobiales archaeon]